MRIYVAARTANVPPAARFGEPGTQPPSGWYEIAAATATEAEALAISWLTFGRQFTPWWEFQTANAILALLGKPERTY